MSSAEAVRSRNYRKRQHKPPALSDGPVEVLVEGQEREAPGDAARVLNALVSLRCQLPGGLLETDEPPGLALP
jgi:hypothetical protein